jgi:hypothetical protein
MQAILNLPDNLITEARRYISLDNQSAAFAQIIQEWLRYKKLQELKQLRGTIMFDGDLTALRE